MPPPGHPSCRPVRLGRARKAKPSSDIDLLIDLDPEAPIGVFESVELTDFIGGLFPVRVDIANRARLKPYVRPQAAREAVYAF